MNGALQRLLTWGVLGAAASASLAIVPESRTSAQASTRSAAPILGGSICPAGTEAVPLGAIDAAGNEVAKEVSAPSVPLGVRTIRSNWNTDWAIPGGEYFEEFVVALVPETNGRFKVEVNLRYGDGTEDEVYEPEPQELIAEEPIYFRTHPRTTLQPYQVNLRVGSLKSGGFLYRAATFGCRSLAVPVVAAAPQTCVPLTVVGGNRGQTRVEKKVNQPTLPGPFGIRFTRNNWNTDWLVPSPERFERFIATIVPEGEGSESFNIRMYLKYSDETVDELFNAKKYDIGPEHPLEITAAPRRGQQPYQVNLYVGGLINVGDRYSATVQGCYYSQDPSGEGAATTQLDRQAPPLEGAAPPQPDVAVPSIEVPTLEDAATTQPGVVAPSIEDAATAQPGSQAPLIEGAAAEKPDSHKPVSQQEVPASGDRAQL